MRSRPAKAHRSPRRVSHKDSVNDLNLEYHNLNKVNISLEIHKNFKDLTNKKNSTIFAIIDGKVIDKYKRSVLSYGDIIRTGTLKKLSEVFKIKKYLTVIRVWR